LGEVEDKTIVQLPQTNSTLPSIITAMIRMIFFKHFSIIHFKPVSALEAIVIVSMYIIIQFGVYIVLNSISYFTETNNEIIFNIGRIISIFIIFYFSEKQTNFEKYYSTAFNFSHVMKNVVIFILFELLAIIINICLNSTIMTQNPKTLNSIFGFLDFINIVLLSPIIEEIFFRWYLISRMRQQCSRLSCILVSSISFALFHSDLKTIIFCIIIGIFLSYIYLKTRNIYFSIFFHFINNLIFFIENIINI
jgi:membrane protease YdiL (CAAX protease family)